MKSRRGIDGYVLSNVDHCVYCRFSSKFCGHRTVQLTGNVQAAGTRQSAELLYAAERLHYPPHPHLIGAISRPDCVVDLSLYIYA